LLSGEDQALLVRGNALLVLDLGLDVVYPYCQPKSSFFGVAMQAPSDAVRCVALPSCGAGICVPMVSLLSTANKLVHALIHSVRMIYTFERDGLARQGLHEDLHLWRCCECSVISGSKSRAKEDEFHTLCGCLCGATRLVGVSVLPMPLACDAFPNRTDTHNSNEHLQFLAEDRPSSCITFLS